MIGLRFRKGVLAGLTALLMAGMVTGSTGQALVAAREAAPQDEAAAAGPVQLIELDSVSAIQKDDRWFLKVRGRASKVPEGTIVQLTLHYSFQDLEHFQVELDASRRIQAELPSHRINGPVERLYVSASVPLVKQPAEVREKIESDPESFPDDQKPWRTSFGNLAFNVGSENDIARRKQEMKEFFKKTILDLVALDRKMEELADAAEAGARFEKDGKLAPEAWMEAVEKEVREPIRKLQEKIREAAGSISYISIERDVGYLRELSAGVARRSLDRSKELYAADGLPYDDEDISPKKLDINTRSKPTSRNLERLVQRICDSRGITLE